MKKDQPKLPTHDFPKPFHIVTSGYLAIKWQPNTHSEREYEIDQLERLHVSIPRTGPLYLFNRADHFFKSTIECHMDDLKSVMKLEGVKRDVLLIVDRGPDNTWKGSLTNLIQYGLLWREMKLQNLAIVGFAPEDSAFNPIERSYSSRTVDITGVIISDSIMKDGTPHVVTKNSSTEDIRAVNDNGVKELSKLWETKVFHYLFIHRRFN